MRYFRAFFLALRMTVRGETVEQRYPLLLAWMQRTVILLDAVVLAANAQGMDESARKALVLHIDKRDISMETILATIRHHAAEEYPYLLRHPTEYNILAIQSSNFNDRYLALSLRDSDAVPGAALRQALSQLTAHLDAIPPAKETN